MHDEPDLFVRFADSCLFRGLARRNFTVENCQETAFLDSAFARGGACRRPR